MKQAEMELFSVGLLLIGLLSVCEGATDDLYVVDCSKYSNDKEKCQEHLVGHDYPRHCIYNETLQDVQWAVHQPMAGENTEICADYTQLSPLQDLLIHTVEDDGTCDVGSCKTVASGDTEISTETDCCGADTTGCPAPKTWTDTYHTQADCEAAAGVWTAVSNRRRVIQQFGSAKSTKSNNKRETLERIQDTMEHSDDVNIAELRELVEEGNDRRRMAGGPPLDVISAIQAMVFTQELRDSTPTCQRVCPGKQKDACLRFSYNTGTHREVTHCGTEQDPENPSNAPSCGKICGKDKNEACDTKEACEATTEWVYDKSQEKDIEKHFVWDPSACDDWDPVNAAERRRLEGGPDQDEMYDKLFPNDGFGADGNNAFVWWRCHPPTQTSPEPMEPEGDGSVMRPDYTAQQYELKLLYCSNAKVPPDKNRPYYCDQDDWVSFPSCLNPYNFDLRRCKMFDFSTLQCLIVDQSPQGYCHIKATLRLKHKYPTVPPIACAYIFGTAFAVSLFVAIVFRCKYGTETYVHHQETLRQGSNVSEMLKEVANEQDSDDPYAEPNDSESSDGQEGNKGTGAKQTTPKEDK